jgi:hypothetical protein
LISNLFYLKQLSESQAAFLVERYAHDQVDTRVSVYRAAHLVLLESESKLLVSMRYQIAQVRCVLEGLLHLAAREGPKVSALLGAAAVRLDASNFLELSRGGQVSGTTACRTATFWRRFGAASSCFLMPFSFSRASAFEIVIFS